MTDCPAFHSTHQPWKKKLRVGKTLTLDILEVVAAQTFGANVRGESERRS